MLWTTLLWTSIAAAAPTAVTGVVTVDDGSPASSLILQLSSEEWAGVATTDAAGAFAFPGVEPGDYTLYVRGDGVLDRVFVLRIGPEQPPLAVDVLAGQQAVDDAAPDEIVVQGQRGPVEITERVLDVAEIAVLPGTGGDAVRAVQNLPGVSRPPLNIGQLLIRGTSPEDSAFYIDGAKVPLVFHFSGFSTVMNSDSLAEVAFLPGNYGVRYGRTLGGVVDLRTNRQLPEESRRYVSVDLFQATAFLEQRVSNRTAITLSGRRSWVDAVLNPVLKNAAGPGLQAPRYYDLQARVLHRSPTRGRFDALLLVSDDAFRFVGGADEGEQTVQLGLATRFAKLRLAHGVSVGGWSVETSIFGGPETQEFAIAPDGQAYEKRTQVGLRHEWVSDDARPVYLRLGADVQLTEFDFLYDVPAFQALEQAKVWSVAPAIFAEPTLTTGKLAVTPGLRLDHYWQSSGYTASPLDYRLSATWAAKERTSFKASAGRYSQFPLERQVIGDQQGNPELTPSWALQTSVGFKHSFDSGVSVEATAFNNALRDLIVGHEDGFAFFTGPPAFGPVDTGAYANDGVGTVRGVESLVRYADGRSTAWVAATVSRSSRVKRPGQDRELFRYDQPLVLTAVGSRELTNGWRLGTRARFGSGNPYTKVVNRFQDLDSHEFMPVYGAIDAARLPSFFSLDVRVDKEWHFNAWDLTVYLDLQNATNKKNPELMSWTYDYGAEDPITSTPLVPAFGLKGAW